MNKAASTASRIAQDITQRKQAEARLRESKERHRAMINQATAGMAKLDLTGKFTLNQSKIL
ncbi:MAG TPA: hypothetical protein VHJ19_14445 [Gammaproteobacteria bacterium]|nr:hypothetical protein [Gammaproteobacteria bacterium]